MEQQTNLLLNPPSDYDMLRIMRVMCEEMRHGWQMSYLLCEHFGDEGKREAAEAAGAAGGRRRAAAGQLQRNRRELAGFLHLYPVHRPGRQVPAQDAVHVALPSAGLLDGPDAQGRELSPGHRQQRAAADRQGRHVPPELIQRYFNKWVPTAFDLFGTDNSSCAHWAYVWGLKGRFDERENPETADKAQLNDLARRLYRDECVRLVDRLNDYIPDRERWLKIPDIKFNRRIGVYGHQHYDVDGEPVSAERYPAYLASVLPRKEEYDSIHALSKEPGWIEARKVSSE